MKCQKVMDEIKAYIDGELGPIMRFRIARHLANCPACREEEQAMSDLTRKLSQVAQLKAPTGLRDRVLAGIKEPTQAARPRFKLSTSLVAAAASVALAAVIVPTIFVAKARTTPEVSAVSQGAKRIGSYMPAAEAPKLAAKTSGPQSAPIADFKGAPAAARPDGPMYFSYSNPPLESPAASQSIIKTADLELKVGKFHKAYDSAVSIAKSQGGYVTDSSSDTEGGAPTSGCLTIRVPVNRFEQTVARLSRLGKVLAKNIRGEDVGGEIVDLESRIRNKRAEEGQYLGIMNRARRVQDVVTVSSELYRVRGEIEEAQGRLKYLRSSVAMSTINLTLREKSKPKQATMSPIQRSWHGAVGSLVATGEALVGLIIWLAVYSPFWGIPLAAWLYMRKKSLRGAESGG